MGRFNLCPNGHYYSEDLSSCPYCSNGNTTTKIKNGTTFTVISKDVKELRVATNVILEFDLAPDGVNRYMQITRKRGDLYLKDCITRIIGCKDEELSDNISQKVCEIEEYVNSELLKKNIYFFDDSDLSLHGDYYISGNKINSIVPDTLLTQILGSGSKLDLLYRIDPVKTGQTRIANTAASCASFSDEGFQNARKEIENSKYLSMSLNDNSKRVLSLTDRNKRLDINTADDYLSEDISAFRPMIVIKEYGKPDIELDWSPKTYSEWLTKIANNSGQSLYFRIYRQRVAEMMSTMLAKLSDLHKNGYIHCDLKPQNILCLTDGFLPIDGINVKKGEVSAGMTMNYCAPEQILTMPVSPATDIYNIGLMLLSVTDGIVYGKTSTFVIPTGGANVKEIKLLTEPMIYIDYESSNIADKDGIVYWKSFLERCLAFEQRNRFQNIESFASEYKRLLNNYPLKNYIEFQPNFGQLALVERNGKFEAGWFVNAE